MRNTYWKFAVLSLALSAFAAGCDSNPTNAPSDQALVDANKKRAAAIDADATLTPEGKKTMKAMEHLDGSQPAKPK